MSHRTVTTAIEVHVYDVVQIPFFPHDELYEVTTKHYMPETDTVKLVFEPLNPATQNPLTSMTTSVHGQYIRITES